MSIHPNAERMNDNGWKCELEFDAEKERARRTPFERLELSRRPVIAAQTGNKAGFVRQSCIGCMPLAQHARRAGSAFCSARSQEGSFASSA